MDWGRALVGAGFVIAGARIAYGVARLGWLDDEDEDQTSLAAKANRFVGIVVGAGFAAGGIAWLLS